MDKLTNLPIQQHILIDLHYVHNLTEKHFDAFIIWNFMVSIKTMKYKISHFHIWALGTYVQKGATIVTEWK